MRHRLATVLVAVGAAVALGVFVPASAPASCVGPSLMVSGGPTATPTGTAASPKGSTVRLRAGQAVTVRGTWFFRGCHDTSGSTGCSAPPEPKPERPARHVVLTLSQGGTSWNLGTADAGPPKRDYAIRWDVVLPSDLRPGDAVLSAGPNAQIHVLVPR